MGSLVAVLRVSQDYPVGLITSATHTRFLWKLWAGREAETQL